MVFCGAYCACEDCARARPPEIINDGCSQASATSVAAASSDPVPLRPAKRPASADETTVAKRPACKRPAAASDGLRFKVVHRQRPEHRVEAYVLGGTGMKFIVGVTKAARDDYFEIISQLGAEMRSGSLDPRCARERLRELMD